MAATPRTVPAGRGVSGAGPAAGPAAGAAAPAAGAAAPADLRDRDRALLKAIEKDSLSKLRRAVHARGSANRGCVGEGGFRPLHTAIEWGRPVCVATLLAMKARMHEKDSRGRTASGVADDVEKSMLRRESLTFNVVISDRDTFAVTRTKANVQKCITILAEDSSDED